MSKIETGGPAFGQVVELRCVRVDPDGSEEYEPEVMVHGGLTVCDYFAAKAMQALISHHGAYCDDVSVPGSVGSEDVMHVDQVSEYAYAQADAMLAARAK